jgi:hypothetical protein
VETQETVLNKLIELSEERATRADNSLVGVMPLFMNKALKVEHQQCVVIPILLLKLT